MIRISIKYADEPKSRITASFGMDTEGRLEKYLLDLLSDINVERVTLCMNKAYNPDGSVWYEVIEDSLKGEQPNEHG